MFTICFYAAEGREQKKECFVDCMQHTTPDHAMPSRNISRASLFRSLFFSAQNEMNMKKAEDTTSGRRRRRENDNKLFISHNSITDLISQIAVGAAPS